MKNQTIFYGKVMITGNSWCVVIPKKAIKYEGINLGDVIKVHIIKKKEVNENETKKE